MITPEQLTESEERVQQLRQAQLLVNQSSAATPAQRDEVARALEEAESAHRIAAREYTAQMQSLYLQRMHKHLMGKR